jgi:hypothetical protein
MVLNTDVNLALALVPKDDGQQPAYSIAVWPVFTSQNVGDKS